LALADEATRRPTELVALFPARFVAAFFAVLDAPRRLGAAFGLPRFFLLDEPPVLGSLAMSAPLALRQCTDPTAE